MTTATPTAPTAGRKARPMEICEYGVFDEPIVGGERRVYRLTRKPLTKTEANEEARNLIDSGALISPRVSRIRDYPNAILT